MGGILHVLFVWAVGLGSTLGLILLAAGILAAICWLFCTEDGQGTLVLLTLVVALGGFVGFATVGAYRIGQHILTPTPEPSHGQ